MVTGGPRGARAHVSPGCAYKICMLYRYTSMATSCTVQIHLRIGILTITSEHAHDGDTTASCSLAPSTHGASRRDGDGQVEVRTAGT